MVALELRKSGKITNATWSQEGLALERRKDKSSCSHVKRPHAPKTIVGEGVGLDDEVCYERRLGDTELSYYLPSRGDGVNDMYLCLSGKTQASFIERERMRLVWSILRLRHPLLASSVLFHDYDDVRFVYELPKTFEAALSSADESMELRSQPTQEMISTLLNGSRILSDEHLSRLFLNVKASGGPEVVEVDFLLLAAHFIGDGMALHTCANDFFTLLSSKTTLDELSSTLEDELSNGWASKKSLPSCLEDRLPPAGNNNFQRVARKVEFLRNQEKDIGGQAFPRQAGLPKKTTRHDQIWDAERTKSIVKRCKSHGVSLFSAIFAVCNLAWARTTNQSPELPMLMYSALNIRPNLIKEAALHDSYLFLAISYFNVVLPSFIPACQDLAPIFWHRSREAKKQSDAARKTSMLTSRCREMARERRETAQTWARKDDGKPVEQAKKTVSLFREASERPPSKAFIGLSSFGNLDAIYKHAEYPGIQLHSLIPAARQRSGGMLLFVFTFAGKLCISFGYDENGFDKAVVETFWKNMLQVMDDYMP